MQGGSQVGHHFEVTTLRHADTHHGVMRDYLTSRHTRADTTRDHEYSKKNEC